jgi:hypothetical protein
LKAIDILIALLAVPVSHGLCPACLAVRQTELDSLCRCHRWWI